MAHEIDLSNGRANMAYRGEKPWHELGFAIEAGDSPEVIAKKAGLTFTIKKGKMLMQTEEGQVIDASDLNRSILYRDDTKARLSVMSTDGYHIVQPVEVVDFIASSAKAMGWEIETAGSLKGGRKIWALANIGEQAEVGKGDMVKGYLLAATACDGTMASEFMFTSVRVVCDNTLHMAVDGSIKESAAKGQARVKVYHFNKLDVAAVKSQLGIAGSVWERFIENAKHLASMKLNDKIAVKILRDAIDPVREEKEVVGEVVTDEAWMEKNTTARKVLELYQGAGIGMNLKSANSTAWGLVNATTEYYDHASRTWSVDNRLNSAWFGKGAQVKQAVMDSCLKIAA